MGSRVRSEVTTELSLLPDGIVSPLFCWTPLEQNLVQPAVGVCRHLGSDLGLTPLKGRLHRYRTLGSDLGLTPLRSHSSPRARAIVWKRSV